VNRHPQRVVQSLGSPVRILFAKILQTRHTGLGFGAEVEAIGAPQAKVRVLIKCLG
jgi:hypothetical protein